MQNRFKFSLNKFNAIIPFILGPLFKSSLDTYDWLYNLSQYISFLLIFIFWYVGKYLLFEILQTNISSRKNFSYSISFILCFLALAIGIGYQKYFISEQSFYLCLIALVFDSLAYFANKRNFKFLNLTLVLLNLLSLSYLSFFSIINNFTWEPVLICLAMSLALICPYIAKKVNAIKNLALIKIFSIALFLAPLSISLLVNLKKLPSLYLLVFCCMPLAIKLSKDADLYAKSQIPQIVKSSIYPSCILGLLIAAGILTK